jgi:hypothetical protein
MQLTLRESSGVFSRAFLRAGLHESVPFDPSTAYIPTTDYFDNRTFYGTSQADLTIQKSARLSLNMGGDGFLTRHRSRALYGMTGLAARGDIQYRLTRRTTIGAGYTYSNFRYPRVFGGTDIHGIAASFARALSARVEFSGFAGVNRAESKFLELVAIDPVITALLGISSGTRVSHSIIYAPLFSGRLSRTFARGVAYVAGGRNFTPGNGLFLTSDVSTAAAGYNYTGVHRWGLGISSSYNRARAFGPFTGVYSTSSAGLHASRTLAHSLHAVWSYSARWYSSPDYTNYNRLIHEVHVGLAFSPGDVPLRFW